MEKGFPVSVTAEEQGADWRAAMDSFSREEGSAKAPVTAEATVADNRPFMVVTRRERVVTEMLMDLREQQPSYTAQALAT